MSFIPANLTQRAQRPAQQCPAGFRAVHEVETIVLGLRAEYDARFERLERLMGQRLDELTELVRELRGPGPPGRV